MKEFFVKCWLQNCYVHCYSEIGFDNESDALQYMENRKDKEYHQLVEREHVPKPVKSRFPANFFELPIGLPIGFSEKGYGKHKYF